MATPTTNYAWPRPTVDADEDAWGDIQNDAFAQVDSDLHDVATTIPIFEVFTSSTFTLAQAGGFVKASVASANNLTVPPNASVAYPVNTCIEIGQYGAGQTSVVAGTGVTIRSAGGKLKLRGQYSAAVLKKIGVDEWWLMGDLVA